MMRHPLHGLYALLGLVVVLSACNTTPHNTAGRSDTLAETYVKLGVGYMQQGKQELALTKLQRALELDPGLAGAHNVIAVLYTQRGELDLADQHYQRALSLDPDDAETYNNYGTLLCRRNELAKAERHFLVALDDPSYDTPALAYENAGVCALGVPDPVKAEGYFRSALQLNPSLPKTLYHMALLNFDAAQYLPARAYLQRYAKVAQHTPESLWLGIRTERALGDKNAVSSYSLLLKSEFPDSEEAGLLLQSETTQSNLGMRKQ